MASRKMRTRYLFNVASPKKSIVHVRSQECLSLGTLVSVSILGYQHGMSFLSPFSRVPVQELGIQAPCHLQVSVEILVSLQ